MQWAGDARICQHPGTEHHSESHQKSPTSTKTCEVIRETIAHQALAGVAFFNVFRDGIKTCKTLGDLLAKHAQFSMFSEEQFLHVDRPLAVDF
jgi:hypothetical protein